ncbi:hypothetical protein R4L22_12230 [Brachyspira pilosicoli]|uniref:hypothetical protein n=1 Tax=Brachyspira pilosicoli TaxID=52584 RepID=UPI000E121A19|nr:hypothetical protein [Brachyspira pilosicoli]SUW04885.1 radical SAM protein [Brachyspira pilosicoli]
MIKRIIYTSDFLSFDIDVIKVHHYWVIDIISNLIEQASNIKIESIGNIGFRREDFFYKSGISNIEKMYYLYDINSINNDSLRYLNEFINNECLILGFELGCDITNIFNKLNITYINIAFHLFKLGEDLSFAINTNNKKIFEILLKYRLSSDYEYFHANYWKNYIKRVVQFDDSFLMDNSAILISQNPIDISVKKEKKFLSFIDFKDELEKLSKDYSKFYYCTRIDANIPKDILDYINSVNYIDIIYDIPTYYFLTSDKIKKVIGMSSSILYEAKYFGKDVHYLYKQQIKIEDNFSIDNYVPINNNFYNPYFYSDILSPIIDTNKNITNDILFKNIQNRIRDMHSYFGYHYLDKIKNIENGININITRINNNENIINVNSNKINAIINNVNCLINELSWWIPIKKLRDNFRNKFIIK